MEEELDVTKTKVTWFFNDEILQEDENTLITFDGTYARLFIAR